MATIIEETTEQDSQTGEEVQPEEVNQDQEKEISEEAKVEEAEAEATDDEQSGEDLSVSFGNDNPEEDDFKEFDRGRLKELRDGFKRVKKQNQELRQQIEKEKPSAPTVPTVGPMPTVEGCDYDTDEFSKKLGQWYKDKQISERFQEQQEAENHKAASAYRQRAENYNKAKQSLKVSDYSDAEAVVEDLLDANQQTVIIEAVSNPAIVVYALGKNPKRAAELAAIKNPVRFAYELSKLESTLKVNKRKPTTSPDKKITGTGAISAGAEDKKLKLLREAAEKSNDLSAVMEYKRQMKAATK